MTNNILEREIQNKAISKKPVKILNILNLDFPFILFLLS